MAPPNQLPTRKLGSSGIEVPALGFGLMGLSIAYGKPPADEERLAVLDKAWELGYTNWDTADVYGDNEDLIGKWFALHPERRKDIFLASKFALAGNRNADGKIIFSIDSSPEYALQCCDNSLKRLNTDYLDLYYMHRTDSKTPIEKTMEAMKKLKEAGKIRAIGLSVVSSNTLRRAWKIAPVEAMQVEYSPWLTDIEGKDGDNLLQTCRELGTSVVAYSPLGRGFLTGRYKSPDNFEEGDMRRGMPRFSNENFAKNLEVVEKFNELAQKKDCKPSQLVLAWVMAQGDDFIPIPGTKNIKYVEENVGACKVTINADEQKEIRKIMDQIVGAKCSDHLVDFNRLADTPELK